MTLIEALVAAFVVLLALSGGLSATLAAVLGISESRARILDGEGFAGAGPLLALRSDRAAIARLGVARVVCSLLATAAGAGAVAVVWGGRALWIGGFTVVTAILVLGEFAPRKLAARAPVRVALFGAPILVRIGAFLGRLLRPLQALGRVVSRRSPREEASEEERQVREVLEIGTEAGVVESDETRLIERAFRLDELNAWDAMTPRVDIVALEDSRTLADVIPELENLPHSRVPVYGGSIDDVTGILYVRDAYRAYVAGEHDTPLSQLARPPVFLPGSLSLAKLLADFRARRVHVGIVADEFGGTDGLITLEDVLEELVGDIVDETDVDEDPVTRLSPEEVIASGGAELRDLNERFGVSLPEDENRSLNGFILEELGRVPEPGTILEAEGVKIEVVKASETQVIRARIRRVAPSRGR